MPDQLWLPNPPDGTAICLGFDGSVNNDHTAFGAETMDGYSFTPRWGPNSVATHWNPIEHGERIPHSEVETALGEMFDRFEVVRVYCDPQDWETDIEAWALAHGEEKVVQWPTNKVERMYPAIRRFEADLREGLIRHDGCPVAAAHIGNAKKVGKPGQKYLLGKPNETQKIDVAMTRIIAHEAKSDALAAGWEPRRPRRVRVWRG
ncbi:terminase [Subtercola sp. YIM 133946]|uniref:terminase n=1 Tax=Subtercola sp. YIM 133946 TaxID=3118909 RepID=UPI002F93BE4E